jgi:hypothetical protein
MVSPADVLDDAIRANTDTAYRLEATGADLVEALEDAGYKIVRAQ